MHQEQYKKVNQISKIRPDNFLFIHIHSYSVFSLSYRDLQAKQNCLERFQVSSLETTHIIFSPSKVEHLKATSRHKKRKKQIRNKKRKTKQISILTQKVIGTLIQLFVCR